MDRKNLPDTFIICCKANQYMLWGDQFVKYMLQHFNTHVAELMKIAKRKTSIDSKHSLNTFSDNREHHRNTM